MQARALSGAVDDVAVGMVFVRAAQAPFPELLPWRVLDLILGVPPCFPRLRSQPWLADFTPTFFSI